MIKKGKTSYYKDIVQGFIDGRKLITSAEGEKLSNEQRSKLRVIAADIESNWEKVLPSQYLSMLDRYIKI